MPEDDTYLSDKLNILKIAKTDQEKKDLIDKIYEDGFNDRGLSDIQEVTEECKQKCAAAGVTLAELSHGQNIMYPVNVKGLVTDEDLIVPHSELALHSKAAGKRIVAWAVTDNIAHVVFEDDACCASLHGLPSEVLSKGLQDATKSIHGG